MKEANALSIRAMKKRGMLDVEERLAKAKVVSEPKLIDAFQRGNYVDGH
jgi:hypothetical protein